MPLILNHSLHISSHSNFQNMTFYTFIKLYNIFCNLPTRLLSTHGALPACTHMLMILPKLIDPQGSCPVGGQEPGAAVGDNRVGPFWLVGHELHS